MSNRGSCVATYDLYIMGKKKVAFRLSGWKIISGLLYSFHWVVQIETTGR